MRFLKELLHIFNKFPPDSCDNKTGRKIFLDSESVLANIRWLTEFYYRLEDEASKKLLIKLIEYAFEPYTVKDNDYLFYRRDEYANFVKSSMGGEHMPDDMGIKRLETFILNGYSYGGECEVKEGDYVFDCGAFTGNSSFFFSKKTGENGRVYAFEGSPLLFSKLQANVEETGCKNVRCENYFISDKDETLTLSPNNRFLDCYELDPKLLLIDTISLNNFINAHQIKKVDFLKIDLDGYELKGINGAKDIIKKYKPRMAVAVSHDPDNFLEIPRTLLKFNPAYKFFLKSLNYNFQEIYLFAFNSAEFKYIENQKEIDAIKALTKTL